MATIVKEQGHEIFFVEVKDPQEVRKNILESLKQILETLQRFEKFKQLRHEKLTKIQKLRNLVRDSNKIMVNLKAKLPQTSLKGMVHHENAKPVQKAPQKKAPVEKPQKRRSTEIERLEAELSAIESKLKSFG